MELILIGVVALLTSGLTLFLGFGLGTILMPAFALFFPAPLGVAAAAVVHFANNAFTLGRLARQADRRVMARLGRIAHPKACSRSAIRSAGSSRPMATAGYLAIGAGDTARYGFAGRLVAVVLSVRVFLVRGAGKAN